MKFKHEIENIKNRSYRCVLELFGLEMMCVCVFCLLLFVCLFVLHSVKFYEESRFSSISYDFHIQKLNVSHEKGITCSNYFMCGKKSTTVLKSLSDND